MNAGIYIHVPFCAVKCPYCDFYSGRYSAKDAAAFTAAVCRNLNTLPQDLPADTVYFGGGTPSLLPPEMIGRMLCTARERLLLAQDAEITLEANPLTVTAERLAAWKQSGINRLSLGVQSFSDETLRMLGRKHTAQQAKAAVLSAQEAGFQNLSVDLMLGLAHQNSSRLRVELETAVTLPVTHLSAYLLKIEPETPFGKTPPPLLSADETADRYLEMHSFLTDAGFCHYEISNFAKKGYASRHNCKYWRGLPYYGIGPAAHSCHDGKRFAVPRDLAAFTAAPLQPETVTDEAALTDGERIMLGLRLSEGICPEDYPASAQTLRRAAAPLIPQYLSAENGRLSMTPEGWLVSNSVLAALLRDIP
ncbi:MAG: radical SAM family heme chaperone HemW [Oscillospiraceae bacterium]|nr:radical SAM family heme chaperone HemW [Oscillospiraceae bacterium]